MKEKVFDALQQASAAHTIRAMTQMFGDQSFSLQNLFAEERHRIMKLLSQETLTRLDQLYTQVYRDNYGVLMAFHRDELSVPQELQVAAEIALGNRCLSLVRSLEQEIDQPELSLHHLAELEAIATEAQHLRCQLNIPQGKQTLEQLLTRSLWQLLHDSNPTTIEADIERLERLIDVGHQLNLGLCLDRVQELYFSCLHQVGTWCLQVQSQRSVEDRSKADSNQSLSPKHFESNQLRQLLNLGQKLNVDVSVLSQLV